MKLRVIMVGMAALPCVLSAQTVPELRGRVRDAAGAPVAGVLLDMPEHGANSWSDAGGNYRLRAPAACSCRVVVSRIGYATRTFTVTLRPGAVERLDIELQPAAIPVASITVNAERSGAVIVSRDALLRSGIVTAADAVASVAGVSVTQSTPGGPQQVSIRGSTSGQVLVLLDGAAINDPLTGSADLSRLRIEQIESITVLPGAASARYGARALAGVISIQTRQSSIPREVALGTGSLGLYHGNLAVSGAARAAAWSASLAARTLDGEYGFRLPPEAGGTSGRRLNADASNIDGLATFGAPVARGQLRLRTSAQLESRGLPGKAFAPSTGARQQSRLLRVGSTWNGAQYGLQPQLSVSLAWQQMRYRDDAPPLGLPYDDTIRIADLQSRLELSRALADFNVTGGLEARAQRVDAATVSDTAGEPGGVAAFGGVRWQRADSRWFAQLQLRGDHDWLQEQNFLSHAISIGRDGPIRLMLAQRSSFAPPSLSDQFFRESVGVVANPDLRAERVRNELEGSADWQGSVAGLFSALRASAYIADTDDLIVWEPDYRFIWSPRNTDVRRRGAEASALFRRGDIQLSGWLAHNRVQYDDLSGDVQVAYRPRNTASIAAELIATRINARIEARYIGERNTARTNLNALPGFWTAAANTSFTAYPRGYPVTLSLRVDRLFNEDESLIFGFPQPGRTFALSLRVVPVAHRAAGRKENQ